MVKMAQPNISTQSTRKYTPQKMKPQTKTNNADYTHSKNPFIIALGVVVLIFSGLIKLITILMPIFLVIVVLNILLVQFLPTRVLVVFIVIFIVLGIIELINWIIKKVNNKDN
jgi:Flp pilus assembly protein TadB